MSRDLARTLRAWSALILALSFSLVIGRSPSLFARRALSPCQAAVVTGVIR